MIEIKDFGTLPDGLNAKLYILKSDNIELAVTDYGTTLVSLKVPDRKGNMTDIVLGYDNVEGYANDTDYYFGCNVGRNANRIGNAQFTINGKEYKLDKNDGENNLHSGFSPYSKRLWKLYSQNDISVTFSLSSPDMDQGFPGALEMYVTYTLVSSDSFKIIYHATPDKDTIINMTNHSYFNLNGQGSGSILNHKLNIYADEYTPADVTMIPTGEISSVENTPMDFRSGKPIGSEIDINFNPLVFANGYDHNWCLNRNEGLHKAITVQGDVSGIKMDLETDYPGIQVYTSNFVNNALGKNGNLYNKRESVCFEPQYYPDAINHANFPSPICKANDTYRKEILYHFYI